MTTNELIQQAAEQRKEQSFLPEYRDGITDADALGVAISNWAEWVGDTIAEAFFSALEDANFHSEREKMIEIWNADNETQFH